MLTMLGPGMALRGPEGSMHKAVDGMKDEFETIATAFHLNMYVFMLIMCAYAWSARSRTYTCTIALTLMALGIAVFMARRTITVEVDFPLRSVPLVSGAFFEQGGAAPTNPLDETPAERARRESRGEGPPPCSSSTQAEAQDAGSPPEARARTTSLLSMDWGSEADAPPPDAPPTQQSEPHFKLPHHHLKQDAAQAAEAVGRVAATATDKAQGLMRKLQGGAHGAGAPSGVAPGAAAGRNEML
jgi:hypothetical protein